VKHHHRTGPPSNQEDRQADDGLQIVSLRTHHSGGRRDHMIKKGQLDCFQAQASSAPSQFGSLAF
jgi:hypothetical protein